MAEAVRAKPKSKKKIKAKKSPDVLAELRHQADDREEKATTSTALSAKELLPDKLERQPSELEKGSKEESVTEQPLKHINETNSKLKESKDLQHDDFNKTQDSPVVETQEQLSAKETIQSSAENSESEKELSESEKTPVSEICDTAALIEKAPPDISTALTPVEHREKGVVEAANSEKLGQALPDIIQDVETSISSDTFYSCENMIEEKPVVVPDEVSSDNRLSQSVVGDTLTRSVSEEEFLRDLGPVESDEQVRSIYEQDDVYECLEKNSECENVELNENGTIAEDGACDSSEEFPSPDSQLAVDIVQRSTTPPMNVLMSHNEVYEGVALIEPTPVLPTESSDISEVPDDARPSAPKLFIPPSAPPMTLQSTDIYPDLPLEDELPMEPLNAEQLKFLYYNPELEHLEIFIEDFLKDINNSKHEFYELVLNYFRARNHLVNAERDVETLRKDCSDYREDIWVTSESSVNVQGKCVDGHKVSKEHIFEIICYNEQAQNDLSRTLNTLRSFVHDELSLYAYSAQLSKLQVESFLHELYRSLPELNEIAANAPVTAWMPPQRDTAMNTKVEKLKTCIQILFMFQRKPSRDDVFVKDTQYWLRRLVATLLRVATVDDHLFLLNHVLRCPAGISNWCTDFIQVVLPPSCIGQPTWSSTLLDHCVTMLATLLIPTRDRERLLYQFQTLHSPSSPEKKTDQPWCLIDSDGEEDDLEENWHYLHENDVVSLLTQIPFNILFKHIMFIRVENETDEYDVRYTGDTCVLKMFAFASCLIEILGYGLDTYSLGRYRQLNKRLGSMIRDVVHYVSEHYENYCTASSSQIPEETKLRLQIEYNQTFCRAAMTILCAQKLGSWQFLADLPYSGVSMETMWQLLWMMHHGYRDKGDLEVPATSQECKAVLLDLDAKHEFREKLIQLPASETTYLISTFTNMARSRPSTERDLIELIAAEIYEIAYICGHTREFCSKVGRDLLSTVAKVHPVTMSVLLAQVKETVDQVGKDERDKNEILKVSLYLFQELPLSLWQPSNIDFSVLKSWILDKELSSVENQLARLIFEKLNWSHSPQGASLHLDIEWHRYVAVMLVEAYIKHLSNKNVASYLTEGMKQMTSVVRNQLTDEQQLSSWAWEMALSLSLHVSTQPQPLPSSPTTGITHPEIPDINDDPRFYPIVRALKNDNPLASYLALVLSRYGHGTTDFCTEGLLLLTRLIEQHHYVPAMRAISYVVPLFYHCSQYLTNNNRFLHVLQQVLYSDQVRKSMSIMGADFPGPITKLMAAMIQHEIQKASLPGGEGGPVVINFWLDKLTKLSRWHQDRNVLHVIDCILKQAYRIPDAEQLVRGIFAKEYKALLKGPREQGVISSIVSWIATGNNLPSLMDTQSSEFCWFAFYVLEAEKEYEEETKLWSTMQQELISNPELNVEQALRKSLLDLKMKETPSINRLVIYRYVHQALDMPLGHPLLPLFWQRFFLLYLGRLSASAGMPERGSVGEKYFESTANTSLLKRMKRRLTEAADYHHKVAVELATPSETDHPEDEEAVHVDMPGRDSEMKQQFHQEVIKLYQTMALWLEEPRLHDDKLYLPALPPQYDSVRLLSLFQNDMKPWTEFVCFDDLDMELKDLAADWTNHIGIPKRDLSIGHDVGTNKATATERILARLKLVDPVKPPPTLIPTRAPVPEVNYEILCDKKTLIYALRFDISSIIDFARTFSMRVSKHVALDCAFLELLPNLYKDEKQEITISIPCQSSFNPTHKCQGPAAVTIRYDMKVTNDVTRQTLDENRAEYKQLMIESLLPPPQNVCSSAVHIENVITALIRLSKSTTCNTTKAATITVGTSLFYYLSSLVSEDTRYYPPTRQFFSSCIEVLGQEFIRNNPTQSQPLLTSILKTPSLVGLLAPNFSPNASPELFVTMYEDMIYVPTNQGVDVAFTLLTKFDVKCWLDGKPPISERSALVEVIGNALIICGNDPDSKFRMVYEVYRRHLNYLLLHRFPDHYGDVLKLIIKDSASGLLSTDVWVDFLKCLGCAPDLTKDKEETAVKEIGRPRELSVQAPHVHPPIPHMRDTVEWLSSYFFRQRVCDTDTASFGLYPKWRPYVPYLCSFFGYLNRHIIQQVASVVRAGDMPPQQSVMDLWQQMKDLFSPWIKPLNNNGQILSPWIQRDCDLAIQMVTMFTDTVRELHAQFEGIGLDPGRHVLELLWTFYATDMSSRGTPNHVLNVFHGQLVSLPWSHFHPDIDAMDLMLKMISPETVVAVHIDAVTSVCKELYADSSILIPETHPRNCFVFLAHIITTMNWPYILDRCVGHDTLTKVHVCLFELLVKMAKEKDIVETTELPQLISMAEGFSWHFLDAMSYQTVTNWYLDNCDAHCIIVERTAKSALVLGLLRVASGFVVKEDVLLHIETPLKRCYYMRCVVQLLCRCSHLKDVNIPVYRVVVSNLLSDIEGVISTIHDAAGQQQEAIMLTSELLNLLNNCNPLSDVTNEILSTIHDWVEESPTSLLLLPLVTAACRTLASVTHMALLLETCIDAHFSTERPLGDIDGWAWVLAAVQVPELSQDEFLEKCVQSCCYLTLFTYTLQRLPLSQNLNDELPHLKNLVKWTNNAKPSRENEAKLFLWWAKIVELMLRQLHFGGDTKVVMMTLNDFVPALFALAEDKNSSGLLGAIGFGKRSQLSQRFRLVTRGLATYLLAQISGNNVLRTDPRSPGSPTTPTIRRGSGTVGPSQYTQQALSQLETLKANKQYAPLQAHTTYILDNIRKADNTIKDTPKFIVHLVGELFQEKRYLAILLSTRTSAS